MPIAPCRADDIFLISHHVPCGDARSGRNPAMPLLRGGGMAGFRLLCRVGWGLGHPHRQLKAIAPAPAHRSGVAEALLRDTMRYWVPAGTVRSMPIWINPERGSWLMV